MESFEGSDILVSQTTVSLQTTPIQLLRVKYQYEYLVKLIETMESAECRTPSKKRRKLSKNLTSKNTLAALTVTFKNERKAMPFLNNEHGKTIRFTGCLQFTSRFSAHICF